MLTVLAQFVPSLFSTFAGHFLTMSEGPCSKQSPACMKVEVTYVRK